MGRGRALDDETRGPGGGRPATDAAGPGRRLAVDTLAVDKLAMDNEDLRFECARLRQALARAQQEPDALGEAGQKVFASMTPLQRMADPAEIGAVAAFLASSDSSFMTASEVAVDGGLAQL